MIGVWLMGADRSDRERILFGAGAEVVAGGGVAPHFILEALSDIEIVAAWFCRPGGAVDARVTFGPNGTVGVPLTANGSRDGDPSAQMFTLTAITLAVGLPFNAPAQETFLVPIGGQVLEAGRGVSIAIEQNATTVRGGFYWRALG
jgi:hypothetical protein